MLNKEEVRARIGSFVGQENILIKQEDLICYTYNAGGVAPSSYLPILVALPGTAEEV